MTAIWFKDQRTWRMVRQGRVGRSKTDYILGSDHQIFENVAIRDLRHNSNHLMVMGCLHRSSLRENSRYLGRRTCLPLQPPEHQTRTRVEKIFSELRRAVLNTDKWVACHN